MEIKQLKLTNNDEIICDIVSLDQHGDLIVVNAFRILNVEDSTRGLKYYYFRPFMVFQENNEQRINSAHIIADTYPSDEMLEHYAGAIKDALDTAENRVTITEDELEAMESENIEIDKLMDPEVKKHFH
jgi:hypothetical protein